MRKMEGVSNLKHFKFKNLHGPIDNFFGRVNGLTMMAIRSKMSKLESLELSNCEVSGNLFHSISHHKTIKQIRILPNCKVSPTEMIRCFEKSRRIQNNLLYLSFPLDYGKQQRVFKQIPKSLIALK
jgi:hypothetical protein